MSGDPRAQAWVEGFDAALKRYGLKLAEPLRGEYIANDNPYSGDSSLRLVSLDAAIEAAAKADHEKIDSDARAPWETCPERWRAGLRDKWRPIITAAVMGGAQ